MYFEFFRTEAEIWQEGYNDAIARGDSEKSAKLYADLYYAIYVHARSCTRDETAKALVREGCSYGFAALICNTSEQHIAELTEDWHNE